MCYKDNTGPFALPGLISVKRNIVEKQYPVSNFLEVECEQSLENKATKTAFAVLPVLPTLASFLTLSICAEPFTLLFVWFHSYPGQPCGVCLARHIFLVS